MIAAYTFYIVIENVYIEKLSIGAPDLKTQTHNGKELLSSTCREKRK